MLPPDSAIGFALVLLSGVLHCTYSVQIVFCPSRSQQHFRFILPVLTVLEVNTVAARLEWCRRNPKKTSGRILYPRHFRILGQDDIPLIGDLRCDLMKVHCRDQANDSLWNSQGYNCQIRIAHISSSASRYSPRPSWMTSPLSCFSYRIRGCTPSLKSWEDFMTPLFFWKILITL